VKTTNGSTALGDQESPNKTDIDDNEEEKDLSTKAKLFRSFAVGAAVVFLLMRAGVPALVMLLAFMASIIFHELGHYSVAKKAGMKVTEFFIGFGPKIFSFQKGETSYGLKLIPLGAYVKIIGMSDLEKVAEEDKNRTYISKPFRWRFATVVAGPGANIVLAFFILLFVSIFIGRTDPSSWYVQNVIPNAPAEQAGVLPGEQIVAVDEVPVKTYDDFVGSVVGRSGEKVDLTVQKEDGSKRNIPVSLGWKLTPEVSQHYKAFQDGDIPLSINNEPIGSFQDFTNNVANLKDGQTVNVLFAREGGVYSVDIPRTEKIDSSLSPNGFLGISPAFNVRATGPIEGLADSLYVTKETVFQSLGAFKGIFAPSSLYGFGENLVNSVTPQNQVEAQEEVTAQAENPYNLQMVTSPATTGIQQPDENRLISIVGIFRLGSQAAEAGVAIFLMLWALINVFLAVVNLIPLLPFDGGHAVIAVWEKGKGIVTRNPTYRVNITKLIPLSYTVIAFFIVLSLSAMWLDIVSPLQNPC